MAELKKSPPDFVVAEFFYGYGNNYAGINISNLDVFLHALRRYAPEAKVIVLVEKPERQYVDKLMALFSIHSALLYPVTEKQIQEVLSWFFFIFSGWAFTKPEATIHTQEFRIV